MIWISQASTKGIAALDYYLVNILVPTSGNHKSLRIPTKLHWCLQKLKLQTRAIFPPGNLELQIGEEKLHIDLYQGCKQCA